MTHIFGRNATLELERNLNVFLEPYGEENLKTIKKIREEKRRKGMIIGEKEAIPVETYSREDGLPMTSHMQNFIDCVRTRERTRCNEDDGFEEAVTLVMSVIAYREKRMVTWDPVKQDIV